LQLARQQGHAYQQALEYMTSQVAHGSKKPAGDYIVGYAVEEAEGMYHLQGGQLQWEEPSNANAHAERQRLQGGRGGSRPGPAAEARRFLMWNDTPAELHASSIPW
jgi:hypothetical protein